MIVNRLSPYDFKVTMDDEALQLLIDAEGKTGKKATEILENILEAGFEKVIDFLHRKDI